MPKQHARSVSCPDSSHHRHPMSLCRIIISIFIIFRPLGPNTVNSGLSLGNKKHLWWRYSDKVKQLPHHTFVHSSTLPFKDWHLVRRKICQSLSCTPYRTHNTQWRQTSPSTSCKLREAFAPPGNSRSSVWTTSLNSPIARATPPQHTLSRAPATTLANSPTSLTATLVSARAVRSLSAWPSSELVRQHASSNTIPDIYATTTTRSIVSSHWTKPSARRFNAGPTLPKAPLVYTASRSSTRAGLAPNTPPPSRPLRTACP